MANVLIQPSFGNAQARSNYAATLENPISFMTGALRDALSEDEFKELYRLHPDGTARFWATPANHDKKMDKLALGDVVLFTGGGRVRAIGEVGASFRNADAGDAMWPPAEKHGSYQNVYSLITFGEAEIPYEVLRKLTAKPNSSGGDNYMGARLLEGHWAERVIDGLLIDTRTEVTAFAEDDVWVGGVAVEDEAHSTGRAEWSAPERQFVASRRESELVVSFREHLTSSGDPRSQKRLKSAVGFSDLYLVPTDPGGDLEIVEAKSSSSHAMVRQAVAQLLDYAAHAPLHLSRLTALFPSAPSDRDTAWLAHLGIDCVYPGTVGFTRITAPGERVTVMQSVWQPARVASSH